MTPHKLCNLGSRMVESKFNKVQLQHIANVIDARQYPIGRQEIDIQERTKN